MSGRGTNTEAQVLVVNPFYVAAGTGCVIKREPATRWSAKRGHAVPVAKGTPDYSGHRHGLAFELEAKEVSKGARFQFKNPKSLRLQIKSLEEFARSGGLAFMLVNFCDASKGLREAHLWEVHPASGPLVNGGCPFLAYAFQAPGSGKSVHVDWFREHAMPVYREYGGLDWGKAIDRVVQAKSIKNRSGRG